ncbi:MAG: glycine cleavage system protein H [Anaeromyxobacteraceae bacterium]
MGHEFLSIYPAKAAEYLLAVSYLLLFIPFWRYVQGARRAETTANVRVNVPAAALAETAPVAVAAKPAARKPAPRPGADWFAPPPAGAWLHPGHTWARLEADGTVAVGLDDLARRLVAAEKTAAPHVGAHVVQGEAAIDLSTAGKSVSALSPVDGTVVAVNAKPGADWLFKVKPSRLTANFRQLYSGPAAKKLMDDAAELLALRADPEMAMVLQDGGTPVHGLASALAGDDWDVLARELLRS